MPELPGACGRFGGDSPWIPGLLGMPVEHDVHKLNTRPWATWIVSGLLVLVALATFGNLHAYALQYGFIPAEPLRLVGLTLFTSFFLHAGFAHLIGNTYFFLIFGDNVEDHLGPQRFLLLLATATLAGHILHGLCDPRSHIPCIGASGGISTRRFE